MPCRKEGTTMKSKIIKLIINIHGNTVDAGGVNKSNGYVYNAYGNTTSTSGNDWTPEKATYYHKVFLKNLTAKCVHGQFGEHDTIPKQSGNIYNKRGISPYPTVTTPLQEGITPVGNKMSFYYVEIAVNQYGAYTPITDWASFCSRDDVMTKDSEELASQAGRSIEEIDREALNAGTSVIYAPAVGSDGTVTEVASRAAITPNSKLTIDTIFRALNYLECQNAEPIGENYVAVVHPNVKYDIISNKDFISVVKYAHAEKSSRAKLVQSVMSSLCSRTLQRCLRAQVQARLMFTQLLCSVRTHMLLLRLWVKALRQSLRASVQAVQLILLISAQHRVGKQLTVSALSVRQEW